MENVSENILKRTNRNIKEKDVTIEPCYTNVIISFYDDNPYKGICVLDSGLILGADSNKKYKSNETGEMEDSEEYIACGKVIAVGPDCKYVKPGEDVYAVKHIATPLPFKNLGYRVINEQHIICRII